MTEEQEIKINECTVLGVESVDTYNDYQKRLRIFTYQNESDPMFFDYQRDEIEKQVWLDKVQEIKDRFPYI
jgi:predicted glycosyltransferase